jgi:hypothetical protein
MDKSKFSFKKIEMKDFLNDVLHALDSKHINCDWIEVKKKKHFHRIPDFILEKKCPVVLTLSDGEPVYQLDVKGEARVLGFIINNVFHIVAYDKNHEIYDMS